MNEIHFDPFDYLIEAEKNPYRTADLTVLKVAHIMAKAARDVEYRRLVCFHNDLQPTRWMLKNQLEKYQSYGVDGRGWRDIYCISHVGI